MKIIKKIIFQQNLELLQRIADDKFKLEYEKEDFIKKYYEWQKQDVSNLNKYHHKVFNDIETFSKDYQFTTEIWALTKKMMKTVPR